MLEKIFEKLDLWMQAQNRIFADQSLPLFAECKFQILGQTALLEAALQIRVTATADVDAYSDAEYAIKAKFNDFLKEEGLLLDPLSNEIWMPKETRYISIYDGRYVKAFRADPVFVLVSKACKAPEKNKDLLIDYISTDPSDEFFKLCKKYHVNLGNLLEIKK